jgi:F-type H+-transporting ATPase subunit epsilon
MIMADFNFELVSPERLLLSERVSEVVIPATEGEMTVMANHAPTMTTVKAADGKVSRYVVFGGFADILPTGCTLLAESAVPVEEVDRSLIEKRIEAAKNELDGIAHGDEQRTRAETFLTELTQLNGILVAF